MTKMMKILLISLLPAFLAFFVFFSFFACPSSAETPAEEYIADVILLDMEHIGQGSWTLYLGAPPPESEAEQEEEISVDFIVRTQLECPFFNSRGNRVTPDEFFVNNEKKVITIEFAEYITAPGSYVILVCRGA